MIKALESFPLFWHICAALRHFIRLCVYLCLHREFAIFSLSRIVVDVKYY